MTFNVHHQRAAKLLAATVALDVILGLAFGFANSVGAWNGLYFATTTATTVGYGDVTPRGWLPHVLAVLIMTTVIPLFTSVFSFITTGLTADHVDAGHEALRKCVKGE